MFDRTNQIKSWVDFSSFLDEPAAPLLNSFGYRLVEFHVLATPPVAPVVRSAFDALKPPPIFFSPPAKDDTSLFNSLHNDLLAFFKANGAKGWGSPAAAENAMWKLRELVFWLSGVGLHLSSRSCHVPVVLTDQSLRSARPSFLLQDFRTYDTNDSKAKKAKRTLTQVGKATE